MKDMREAIEDYLTNENWKKLPWLGNIVTFLRNEYSLTRCQWVQSPRGIRKWNAHLTFHEFFYKSPTNLFMSWGEPMKHRQSWRLSYQCQTLCRTWEMRGTRMGIAASLSSAMSMSIFENSRVPYQWPCSCLCLYPYSQYEFESVEQDEFGKIKTVTKVIMSRLN